MASLLEKPIPALGVDGEGTHIVIGSELEDLHFSTRILLRYQMHELRREERHHFGLLNCTVFKQHTLRGSRSGQPSNNTLHVLRVVIILARVWCPHSPNVPSSGVSPTTSSTYSDSFSPFPSFRLTPESAVRSTFPNTCPAGSQSTATGRKRIVQPHVDFYGHEKGQLPGSHATTEEQRRENNGLWTDWRIFQRCIYLARGF
jgi:hypothetical protein